LCDDSLSSGLSMRIVGPQFTEKEECIRCNNSFRRRFFLSCCIYCSVCLPFTPVSILTIFSLFFR
jgi:late competence protein required for DNA uptake (superfamily II DNA/RNA helicase)